VVYFEDAVVYDGLEELHGNIKLDHEGGVDHVGGKQLHQEKSTKVNENMEQVEMLGIWTSIWTSLWV